MKSEKRTRRGRGSVASLALLLLAANVAVMFLPQVQVARTLLRWSPEGAAGATNSARGRRELLASDEGAGCSRGDLVDPRCLSNWNALRVRIESSLMRRGYEPGSARYERAYAHRLSRGVNGRIDRKIRDHRLRRNLEREKDIWMRSDAVGEGGDGGEELREARRMLEVTKRRTKKMRTLDRSDYKALTICGRAANIGDPGDPTIPGQHSQCPELTNSTPVLLLSGLDAYGQTGSNLIELLHAMQHARDEGMILGIGLHSWASKLIARMWMSAVSEDWEARPEDALCLRVFRSKNELEGLTVVHKEPWELYLYNSQRPLGEYMASQGGILQALFRNYNAGRGTGPEGREARDMCSGINALFGGKRRDKVIYSAIHIRQFEGDAGETLLGRAARTSGCDPRGALRMDPEYVKSILRPLGMLDHPVVVVTDGEYPPALEGLLGDDEITRAGLVVPDAARWDGGDMTLAIMADVFIGNPASAFSGFVAKSRLALGFGHSYLFRAKDERGEWRTVCGDSCIFDRTMMGPMS